MKLKLIPSLLVCAALAASNLLAQPPMMSGGMSGGMPPGMNPFMASLLGKHSSGSFEAESTFKDPSLPKPMVMSMKMSASEGKLRMEFDLTDVKGGKMPPNTAARMKAMGMDKMVFLIRPDKKVNTLIYPGLQSYTEVPMNDSQVESAAKTASAAEGKANEQQGWDKANRKSLGRETIDGRSCEKYVVSSADGQGKNHEIFVWLAPDLHDFPVQMEFNEGDHSFFMKFKNINTDKPDAKLFEAPSDFTKYDSMQQMMQTEMMKRASSLRGRP